MVHGWFFMVLARFSWFFMVLGQFFWFFSTLQDGFSKFFMIPG